MFRSTELNNESLLPGPNTFTLERIQSQLRHDSWTADPDSSEAGIPGQFVCEGFDSSREGGVHRIFSEPKRNELREMFCRDLYEQSLDPTLHLSRLDDRLSQLVSCNLRIEGEDDISDHTYQLLMRLPARPLQLPDIPLALRLDYLVHDCRGDGLSTTTVTLWDSLQVTSYVSASVIRFALLSVIDPRGGMRGNRRDFLNTVADLISTTSRLSSSADSELAKQTWFVVRAFLWTSWQRCNMIYFFAFIGVSLESGIP